MRKTLLLTISLALLALAASACDVSALPYAARVGGVTIPSSRLNGVLDAFQSDAALKCVFAQQGKSISGAGSGNFASGFTSDRLSELVDLQIESSLINKFHLTRTSYATSTANSQLVSGFSPSQVGTCTSSGQSFINAIPSSYRSVITGLEVDQIVLDGHLAGATLSTSGIAAYEQAHPATMTLACLSDILVTTKAEALKLAGELQQGANFSSLAKANSADTSTAAEGGAIGCVVPNDLVSPINKVVSALSVGQVSAPISFNGDYALLKVTGHQGLAPPAEALQAILDSESAAETALVRQFASAVGVEINPQYGNWVRSNTGAQVNPPVGPGDSLLVNSAAVGPLATT